MTPKLKAEELVLKFEDYTDCADERGFAIKCALITVSEIITAVQVAQTQIPEYTNYWQQVKQEIENL